MFLLPSQGKFSRVLLTRVSFPCNVSYCTLCINPSKNVSLKKIYISLSIQINLFTRPWAPWKKKNWLVTQWASVPNRAGKGHAEQIFAKWMNNYELNWTFKLVVFISALYRLESIFIPKGTKISKINHQNSTFLVFVFITQFLCFLYTISCYIIIVLMYEGF